MALSGTSDALILALINLDKVLNSPVDVSILRVKTSSGSGVGSI